MGKGFSHTKYFCTKGATQTMSAVPQMHELHVSTFHRSAAAPLQLRRPVPVRRNTSHVLHIFHHVYHHFQLRCFQVKSSLMKDAMSQSLIEQGFSGDIVLDYLDVDTDPMEKFESGYPYRPLVET